MFRIGDIVQHRATGKVGKVVGYGCRVSDRISFLTLKVKPFKGIYFQSPMEDSINEWRFLGLSSSKSIDRDLSQHRLIA